LATPRLQLPDVETMPAEDVLRWAHAEFGDRLCLTCSWQKQSSVLVHMVAGLGLEIPVVELDTHLFFRESYETRDRLVERYGITLLPPPPVITIAEQHRAEGPNLWENDPDRCCHIRKVEPLLQALEPYDAWISGIRRDQSPTRADAPKLAWDEQHELWKANPLADWTDEDCWAYIRERGLPYNALHDQGYESIGDTHSTLPGKGREGRWAGTERTECGLHT
jgi:phosphoadenosine phosphosulfate reductase